MAVSAFLLICSGRGGAEIAMIAESKGYLEIGSVARLRHMTAENGGGQQYAKNARRVMPNLPLQYMIIRGVR